MKRAEIEYVAEGVVRHDTVDAEQLSAGIVSDGGRGYIRTPGEQRLYRRIERIVIHIEDPS